MFLEYGRQPVCALRLPRWSVLFAEGRIVDLCRRNVQFRKRVALEMFGRVASDVLNELGDGTIRIFCLRTSGKNINGVQTQPLLRLTL